MLGGVVWGGETARQWLWLEGHQVCLDNALAASRDHHVVGSGKLVASGLWGATDRKDGELAHLFDPKHRFGEAGDLQRNKHVSKIHLRQKKLDNTFIITLWTLFGEAIGKKFGEKAGTLC